MKFNYRCVITTICLNALIDQNRSLVIYIICFAVVFSRVIVHWFDNIWYLFPQAISNKDQHSISYTLSRAQTVVVEYTHDSNTDMFQVCKGSIYKCILPFGGF